MNNSLETFEKDGYTATVNFDHFADDPREYAEHTSEMLSAHRRYIIGDRDASVEEIKAIENDPDEIWLPVYLYDHSGLTINTTGKFNVGYWHARFDSGRVGIIHISRQDAIKEGIEPREGMSFEDTVKAFLLAEVETYDQYLTDDVYFVEIFDPDGEVLDSCGQMFGREHAEQSAKDQLEHFAG
jgi:hypothetical protein